MTEVEDTIIYKFEFYGSNKIIIWCKVFVHIILIFDVKCILLFAASNQWNHQ